jgi:FkbM family methyltransferase
MFNFSMSETSAHRKMSISMSSARDLVKSGIVFWLGRETKARKILGGIARGYRMHLSPSERLSYLLGTNERHLQHAIRRWVAPGDTVYDIGANIGYVSLSLAKRVGSEGHVIAFEPVPENAEAFRRNIELNDVKNIRLFEFAASDRPGRAVIRLLSNNSTASLVWHNDNPAAKQVPIQAISIDDLVEAGEIPHPKFVKIDVEGAEASVLQGMYRTLTASMPVVFVECSEIGREKSWQLMTNLGYKCQSAISRKPVEKIEHYRHSDFLWLHEGKQ